MIKLNLIIKESEDISDIITSRTIFNFYYLWHTVIHQPSLIKTPYGKEIMNYYLQQFKVKYVKLFKKLVIDQIIKYIQQGRIDPDFPQNVVQKLGMMSAKELWELMSKTFRSDMKRRNDAWNMCADFLTHLEFATSPKDIFVYINQLNNIIHNSGGKILDKFPNYYSELRKAFDLVDKTTNIQMLKSMVDKDIVDLWNQAEEGSPYESDSKPGDFTETIMIHEGLEKVLRMKS